MSVTKTELEEGICEVTECDNIVNDEDGETICRDCKCALVEIEQG